MRLQDLFARYPYPVAPMLAQIRDKARELGLPMTERSMTYNSRLAQELGLWAQENERGGPFHKAAFQAYFAEGENIHQEEILLRIVRQAGLDEKNAHDILVNRSYADAVERDWRRSQEMGIRAVPSFAIDGDVLVGAQDYQTLARFVGKHGAVPVG